MTSFDAPSDPSGDAPDERVLTALQSLPMPTIPHAIESRVRQRLRRQRVDRVVLAATVAASLLAGLFAWRPWAEVAPGPTPLPQGSTPMAQSSPLQPEELDVLFAPPPVDPLTILARRDNASLVALNRLEGGK